MPSSDMLASESLGAVSSVLTDSLSNHASSISQKSRQVLRDLFIQKNGLADAVQDPLGGDASFRSYLRLKKVDGTSLLVMDAPPPQEDVRPFIEVDRYLIEQGLRAPKIYAEDRDNGFLLLEDFGCDSYTHLLSSALHDHGSLNEGALYARAIDVLIELHQAPAPSFLSPYSEEVLLKEVSLLTEWFLPHAHSFSDHSPSASSLQELTSKDLSEASSSFSTIWKELFANDSFLSNKSLHDVVVLRDYHADNLMWLSKDSGLDQVGLLDFQDALLGSPAYDIISLLEDARRDILPATAQMAVDRYLAAFPSLDKGEFFAHSSLIAAQRNCKIIGIFARLAMRDGKGHYLDYLPRVWGHLINDLQAPALHPLKEWFLRYKIL